MNSNHEKRSAVLRFTTVLFEGRSRVTPVPRLGLSIMLSHYIISYL